MAYKPTTEGKKSDKRQEILDEVVTKVAEYQTRMATFMQDYNDWSDLFTVKKPQRNKNSFSNPASTATFTAARALAGTEYKMLTSQDPFFEFFDNDGISASNPDSIHKATELIRTQLEYSKYRANLFKALLMKNVFGTVVVEEPFDILPISYLGRKLPMLKFEPRSLLQIAFDKGTTEIENGQWISTSDIVNTNWLKKQVLNEGADTGWIKEEVDGATSKEACTLEINEYIRMRLVAAGYDGNVWPENARELITYYGKLDCKDDGVEYIVCVINRKYIVKFADNPIQTGRRPFRVAHYLKWELEPLGYGIGKLFSHLHKGLNNNRQRIQDLSIFTAYNPLLRNRLAGINDKDGIIRPMAMIDSDDINNSFAPVPINQNGITNGINLEAMLLQEFKTATGATDTLIANVTNATASEVTLAQNEAMRSISISAEIDGQVLIREHIENMHMANMLYIKDRVQISSNGQPMEIYPNDITADFGVSINIITDRDFKPERLKKLIEYYTALTSIRNTNPDLMSIDIRPLVAEINKSLDVPGNVIRALDPQRIQEIQMSTQLQQGFMQSANPGSVGNMGIPNEQPPESGQPSMIQTPVGQVPGSPI